MNNNNFIKALKMLDKVDLLGAVGRFIIEHADEYPATVENGNTWIEEQGSFENAYNQMATSELVGGHNSNAQLDWIAEEETEKFESEFYEF